MKRESYWWGIKLIAESSEDAKLLVNLSESLWKENDDNFVELITPIGSYPELKLEVTK